MRGRRDASSKSAHDAVHPGPATFVVCGITCVLRAVQDLRRLLGKPPVDSRAITFLTGN
jgi:hypothetical protein